MRGRTPCISARSSATAPIAAPIGSSEQSAALWCDAEHRTAQATKAGDVVVVAAAIGRRVTAALELGSIIRRLENGERWTRLEQCARPIALRPGFTLACVFKITAQVESTGRAVSAGSRARRSRGARATRWE